MYRSIRSFNIPSDYPPPPAFDLEKIDLLKPRPRGKELFSNAPTNFFVKGKISNCDFLHID